MIAVATIAYYPAVPARSKITLKAVLLAQLEAALATARAAHKAAVEGATHAEARPENDKDTRGLEQSYLARGVAQRAAELEAAVAAIAGWQPRTFASDAAIAVGALVEVDDDGRARHFLVAGHGGGLALPGEVMVVTPSSPIGRALLGRRVDDDCEVDLGGGRRTLSITAVE
jgi:transcription elongation GreA/GreB family factor